MLGPAGAAGALPHAPSDSANKTVAVSAEICFIIAVFAP